MTKKKGVSVFVCSAAAVLAAAVIRFFLYMTAIDYKTGFYTAEGAAVADFFRGLLLIFTVLFFVLCLVGERRRWTVFSVSSDGLGNRVTLFLGLIYLAAAALAVLGMAGAEEFSLLSVAEAVFYAAVGLLMIKNTAASPAAGALHVGLSLLCFLRALILFNGDLVIRNHSDPMLRLLAYVFGSLFFASSARCYARLEMKHSRLRELFLGGTAFLFSGAYTLGKLSALLLGGNRVLGMETLDRTAAAVFLISGGFLAALCFTRHGKEIEYLAAETEKEGEESPETDASGSARAALSDETAETGAEEAPEEKEYDKTE